MRKVLNFTSSVWVSGLLYEWATCFQKKIYKIFNYKTKLQMKLLLLKGRRIPLITSRRLMATTSTIVDYPQQIRRWPSSEDEALSPILAIHDFVSQHITSYNNMLPHMSCSPFSVSAPAKTILNEMCSQIINLPISIYTGPPNSYHFKIVGKSWLLL